MSPQLSCGDTCQIWLWVEKFNLFCFNIMNIYKGEINHKSFSNPQRSSLVSAAWVSIDMVYSAWQTLAVRFPPWLSMSSILAACRGLHCQEKSCRDVAGYVQCKDLNPFSWRKILVLRFKTKFTCLFPRLQLINTMWQGDMYMHQWNGSSLFQVFPCHLWGAKPLPEPVMTYYQMNL